MDENKSFRNQHNCVQGPAGSQRHRQGSFQKVAPGLPWTQLETCPRVTQGFWEQERGLPTLTGLKIPTSPTLTSSSDPTTGKQGQQQDPRSFHHKFSDFQEPAL